MIRRLATGRTGPGSKHLGQMAGGTPAICGRPPSRPAVSR
jgi:hypothetical protein